MPLTTLQHDSIDSLQQQLLEMCAERHIDHVVVGLPYLLSGEKGEQAERTEKVIESLNFPEHISISTLDERYTTPKGQKNSKDEEAACFLLQMYLDRQNI